MLHGRQVFALFCFRTGFMMVTVSLQFLLSKLPVSREPVSEEKRNCNWRSVTQGKAWLIQFIQTSFTQFGEKFILLSEGTKHLETLSRTLLPHPLFSPHHLTASRREVIWVKKATEFLGGKKKKEGEGKSYFLLIPNVLNNQEQRYVFSHLLVWWSIRDKGALNSWGGSPI